MIDFSLSGSFRTGIILKYVVAFKDADIKVSNDVFAGDATIDADVSVSMSRLTAGATFEITLYDLPEKQVQKLFDQMGPQKYPKVSIQLGYLDTSTGLVMDGIYDSIDSSVDSASNRLVTKVKGKESGFYALSATEFTEHISGDVAYDEVLKKILAGAKVPKKGDPNGTALPDGLISTTPSMGTLPAAAKPMHNPRFAARKVITIIDELATQAGVEFLVTDKRLFFGGPVLYDDYAPAPFDRGTNLAKFQPAQKDLLASGSTNVPKQFPATQMTGFAFTVVGDPKLRPGQKVSAKVKGYDASTNPEFRIRWVKHNYSSTNGYTCDGFAARRDIDAGKAREADAAAERSAASAAASIGAQIKQSAFERPALEVTSVKAYHADKHRADLYYGQPEPGEETQPSINLPTEQLDKQLFEGKPVVAPFAWRKCGLVTPLYPGMKAVLGHNRAISSDGMVMGFLWSHDPDFAPPANHDGDWWLCLPIDFDATQPPADSTKAVNDLTGNDGLRVIELKGLKITVGTDALKEIGKRPTAGDADTCSIEHASGAKITITKNKIEVNDGSASPATITLKDGEITLAAGGAKLSLKKSEISLTDGSLTLKLSGGQASFA